MVTAHRARRGCVGVLAVSAVIFLAACDPISRGPIAIRVPQSGGLEMIVCADLNVATMSVLTRVDDEAWQVLIKGSGALDFSNGEIISLTEAPTGIVRAESGHWSGSETSVDVLLLDSEGNTAGHGIFRLDDSSHGVDSWLMTNGKYSNEPCAPQ